MAAPRIYRAHRPLTDEPKHFTRIPDDALEDPRLSTTTIAVFTALLRNVWTSTQVIRVTMQQIADRARLDARTARREIARLETCGYLIRERDYTMARAPHQIRLTYQLRPSLQLESEPAVKSRKSTCDRTGESGCNRTGRSGCNRTPVSGPFLLFEREKTTTTETSEPSSSFSASPRSDDSPTPAVPVDLVDRVQARWPDEALIDRRLVELLSRGDKEGRLAIEYAELMGAKGLVYAIKTRDRWHRDGYDLDDCRAEVQAQRPKPAPAVPTAVHRAAGVQPETAPTPEEIQGTLDGLASSPLPAVRRLYEATIRGWIAAGHVPADSLPGAQNDGRGSSRQLAPRPSGVHPSESPSLPDNERTVKVCSRQETTQSPTSGQRARKDSNLQPSDSKPASETPVRDTSGPSNPAPTDILGPPTSEKLADLSVRRFSPG